MASLPRSMLPALLIPLAACGHAGPAYCPPTPGVTTVAMTGFSFEPAGVRIRAGDTVEWRNRSVFAHTVSADPQRNPALAAIAAGASAFESERIPAGGVFRQRFTVPGTYRYYCDRAIISPWPAR